MEYVGVGMMMMMHDDEVTTYGILVLICTACVYEYSTASSVLTADCLIYLCFHAYTRCYVYIPVFWPWVRRSRNVHRIIRREV